MRFIIICLLMVSVCYGQTKTTRIKNAEVVNIGGEKEGVEVINKVDSLSLPLLSIADMEKLNVVIMKQFDLTEQSRYNNILKELQRLIAEAKKRKK